MYISKTELLVAKASEDNNVFQSLCFQDVFIKWQKL